MSDPKDDSDAGGEDHDSAAQFLRDVARAPSKDPGLPAPSLVGVRIAHFLVGAKLGEGGMGVVYEAEDEKLTRVVALKVLPRVVDAESRTRFLREARAASRIVHPSVATVYEVGESEAGAYIAMEYVRGETMRDWLMQPRSIAARLRILREIASALAEAHAQGVIHRDLKPDNVMITTSGLAKVLDFGLAKQSPRGVPGLEETVTAEGRILGTPSYMSPEQAKGQAVDARSDVFSFGVLMYEAFTGKRPFTGDTAVAVLIAIDRDEPAPVTKHARDLPPEIARIIHRALAKKPEDRLAGGRELAAALEAVTLPLPRASRLPRFLSVRWVRALLVLAALLELSLLAFAVHWGLAHGPKAHSVAPVTTRAPGKAMTDFVPTTSKNEAALETYRRGMQSLRSALDGGCSLVQRAGEIDPGFAEAHLRASLCRVDTGDFGLARASFREAAARRGVLSERDRVLLDAFEPMVERSPSDPGATEERMKGAALRFPDDAEIAYYRALAAEHQDPASAGPLYARALELDPAFARAWLQIAYGDYATGRIDDGDRAIDRCLSIAPDSVICIEEHAAIDMWRGSCAAAELEARRVLTVAPRLPTARGLLAAALAGEGRPVGAIRELIDQTSRGASDGGPPDYDGLHLSAVMSADADLLEGNFDAALGRFRVFEPLVAQVNDEATHAWIAVTESRLLTEMGRAAEAQAVARDFLARHDAWEPSPGGDIQLIDTDGVVELAAGLRRAGLLSPSELARLRTEDTARWLPRVRTPEQRGMIWVMSYAAASDTPEEATEALAALSAFGHVPEMVPLYPVDAVVGHVTLLAGRIDDALPLLERATRACDSIGSGWAHTRAYYDLGMAREAKGDTAGACASYASLLARWGSAKPRSITAEKTLARAKAIRCAK